ncbi:MAG: alpha/beta hydrolase [Proteobacteria bacterium]|nr:alpha/beta hydrolase [Pseudomonadota bacterium]
MTKIVFIPGNGGSDTQNKTQDNWFPSLKSKLEAHGLEVISAKFPDPDLARETFWIPFLSDDLKVDKNTILVGHSSGAVAAMRFAEKHEIMGSVLVGACYTDLGDEKEKLSGYFDRPWNWDAIKKNQQWTILFASQDDPWIPIKEARYIHDKLNCEYHEYKDQGHFGGNYDKKSFPELSQAILRNLEMDEK